MAAVWECRMAAAPYPTYQRYFYGHADGELGDYTLSI